LKHFWHNFLDYPRVYPQPVKLPTHPVWVIAHRGASIDAPENTLSAFELAIQQGADMLELDVRLSKDQEVIVFHDRSLKRTASQDYLLNQCTLLELKHFDAGAWFGPRFVGEEIPTLAEVLQMCAGRIMLNIEIKKDAVFRSEDLIEKKILALLEQYNMLGHVMISSFEPLALKRIKAREPQVSTALLYGNTLHSNLRSKLPVYNYQAFRWVLAVKADSLNLRYPLVTAASMRRSRETRIRMHPFTSDSVKSQKKLIRLGVDGIITNRPERLQQVLKKYSERIPAQRS
jgi:glycerophosphoryl diester phosphodiesterase